MTAATKTAPSGAGVSFGFSPEVAFDPWRFKAIFPDRWSAFLRAHLRSVEHAAVFFGVTERAARDWCLGASGARGSHVAIAFAADPEGARRILLEAA